MDPAELTWDSSVPVSRWSPSNCSRGSAWKVPPRFPTTAGADAITAIMGNHVDVSFMQVGDLGSAVESGNVKPC